MNEKTFNKKVNRDVDQTKRDFTSLGEGNLKVMASIKKDLVTLGEDGITKLSRKFQEMAYDIKEMVTDKVMSLNKNIGHGLSQYNAKVQKVADKVPGNFSKKVVRYPWVSMSIILAGGIFLGILLKPARRSNV